MIITIEQIVLCATRVAHTNPGSIYYRRRRCMSFAIEIVGCEANSSVVQTDAHVSCLSVPRLNAKCSHLRARILVERWTVSMCASCLLFRWFHLSMRFLQIKIRSARMWIWRTLFVTTNVAKQEMFRLPVAVCSQFPHYIFFLLRTDNRAAFRMLHVHLMHAQSAHHV